MTGSLGGWRRIVVRIAAAVFTFLASAAGGEAAPLHAVASFSILADILREVGGADVVAASLVGPDADAHVFEPSPDQVRLVARAQIVVVNGLGLEGWLTRLVQSAHYRGPVVVASHGIASLEAAETAGAKHAPDPHAWQDVGNAVIYAENIAQALIAADPAHGDAYRERLAHYRAALDALDRRVRDAIAAIPQAERRVITTHDAFAYYGRAYGVSFLAPEGMTTDSEPSAQAVAGLIRQIRRERIRALFLENISDPRLMQALAQETGAALGPALYSDALSGPAGPAPTYLRMIEHNTAALVGGMRKN
jgi:zinc/manganese transport system substrate-binding protein